MSCYSIRTYIVLHAARYFTVHTVVDMLYSAHHEAARRILQAAHCAQHTRLADYNRGSRAAWPSRLSRVASSRSGAWMTLADSAMALVRKCGGGGLLSSRAPTQGH